jgi:hypothetical protein
MHEVFANLDHVATWRAAARSEPVNWPSFLAGYVAAVDWPVSAFWRDIASAFPDAPVVLSVRADAATWWDSANATIFEAARNPQPPEYEEWQQMFLELLAIRFTPSWDDARAAMAAYEAHNAAVRAGAGPRLLEWRAEEGWTPLCRALGVPVPSEPFPHANRREEW